MLSRQRAERRGLTSGGVATSRLDEYQGVGRVKSGYSMNRNDEYYRGNSFVASYQELPQQELRALAVAGDKLAR
ncbi:hypothetical protein [Shewanella sp. c952]|uniref:hypothetical protein n=1 Tax=Shewanella sp. c952 TaxID=2815913 RepID=UPI001C7DC9D9|nr:hypothetical protein [Shewanella sp. c952]